MARLVELRVVDQRPEFLLVSATLGLQPSMLSFCHIVRQRLVLVGARVRSH